MTRKAIRRKEGEIVGHPTRIERVMAKTLLGLDGTQSKIIDWALAVKRVLHDVRSDFLYAPHLTFIYANAASELIAAVLSDLNGGTYAPGLPLTIEVPKSSRMRISGSPRQGPAYTRPGSILLPKDRLFYQVLADMAAPLVDAKTDHSRSFSHKLSGAKSEVMFQPNRHCWNELQKTLNDHAAAKEHKYVLKTDISNCFGALNQHTLIHILEDAGFPAALSAPLEKLLVKFTGERSSRGILQGIYPSDLFGNFYLSPVDRFLQDRALQSARYVDDIYVFLDSVEAADNLLREFIPFLRSYDLTLNETKSLLLTKYSLMAEEPDLEALFQEAFEEISSQVDEDDIDEDYGFQSNWDNDDNEGQNDDLELQATISLFDSIDKYPGQEEKIERFCLPLFGKAASDYAVVHVIDAFKKRPSMAQIYASYLARFLDKPSVSTFLIARLMDTFLLDWQRLWVLAALLGSPSASDNTVKAAWDVFKDGHRHEGLRAVAAIFVGRYGDLARRKALVSAYASAGSTYIQLAIYFSSRWFPGAERANAESSWGGETPLHLLMSAAMKNKKA